MTKEAEQKLLKQIDALMRKAESLREMGEEYWAEAESCVSKTHELLGKYQLSMSDVILAGKPGSEITHVFVDLPGPYNGVKEWMRLLGFSIGRYCGGKAFTVGDHQVMFMGRKADISVMKSMFESLSTQLSTMCEIAAAKAYEEGIIGSPRHGKIHGRSWRREYFLAAVDELRRRMESDVVVDETMKAIVLVTKEQLEKYQQETFQMIGTYRASYVEFSVSAERAGRQAGREVSFRQEIDRGDG